MVSMVSSWVRYGEIKNNQHRSWHLLYLPLEYYSIAEIKKM